MGNVWVIGEAITFNDATYFQGVFAWLALFDPAGQPASSVLLDLTANGDEACGIAVADNGDVYIVGHVDYLWGCVWVPGVGQRCDTISDSDVFIIRIPGPEPEIVILPTTTRWKPQRDAARNIEVNFTGPKDLKPYPDTKLEVTDPTNAILADPALVFTQVSGDSDPAAYRFIWSGLRAPDGTPTWRRPDGQPLPAGNYAVRVVGKTADEWEVTSQPYSRITLVEVKSVEIRNVTGDALETDPPMPLSGDERAAAVNRAERPGGGLRVFAESALPGGPVDDDVAVQLTIEPVLDIPVPVNLRAIDVADPDASPPNPGEPVHDNFGSAEVPATVEVPANARTASTVLKVSHQPGDNFRVLASTAEVWMNDATAVPGSLVGEVHDRDGYVLPESGDDTSSAQLSRLLTVWRTLHLEIDSTAPEPADPTSPERNFIDGQVKTIQGYRDAAIRFTLYPDAPPAMDRLADGSLDADSTPTKGKGRFENGTIRLGTGQRAEELGLGANGLEYVEAPSLEAGGRFLLRFVLLGADGEIAFCGGRVISGSPIGGSFDLNPRAGSWSEAQTSAVWLDIAGVRYPIVELGPTTLNEDNVLVGTATVSGDGTLPFHLTDDDEATAPFEINTSLIQDSDDPNENVLAAAYIRPRVLQPGGPEGYRDAKTAPFNRNIECPLIDRTGGLCDTRTEIIPVLSEGRDLDPVQSTETHWLMYVQGVFQAGQLMDNDPDQEADVKFGSTVGHSDGYGTLVYVEALREAGGCASIVVAHELGHQFGLDHALDNPALMKETCYRNGRYFLPQELRSIRAKGDQP